MDRRHFGRTILRARMARGLTLLEVATAIGVDHAAVCRWQSGRTVPSSRYVVGLCQVLGLTPNQLFGWPE